MRWSSWTVPHMPHFDEAVRNRLGTVALWVGLLGAAWSLPLLGLWQQAEERARMESGIYYTPQRPAAAYLEAAEAP
ncbi:hypothetical protein [Niveispirillum irakense]|uniref:hypothetical protein n=1 Tax=Niveispirillum irakense TaxID=34011 RepID=UPI001FDEF54D|nr:hypothetical protein [Niveispirillum irakense]